MQLEVYKFIEEYPDYEVSNLGNVISHKCGKTKVLKLGTHHQGYKTASIANDNKRVGKFVHRLVALAFLGDSNGLEINHKNGIKSDNRVENLEWVTPKENIAHAYKLGLRIKPNITTRQKMAKSHTGLTKPLEVREKIGAAQRGEKSRCARLTWKIVEEIRSNTLGLSQRKLAEKYGVIQQHISDIINNKKWRVANNTNQ